MKKEISCPYCFKKIPDKNVRLSEKDFNKLKVGSIIISKNGCLRKIIKKGKYSITLLKVQAGAYNDPYTTYFWNDIKRNYKVVKF